MILFIYDHTFEGLLTCIFDAYFRKTFPDSLLMEGEPLPLFYDEAIHIATDEEKAGRVWRGLQKKISKHALFCLTCCWLSELRLSGNFWLVSFKISYLCLPLFYETRTTPSCHPSGCAYRQL